MGSSTYNRSDDGTARDDGGGGTRLANAPRLESVAHPACLPSARCALRRRLQLRRRCCASAGRAWLRTTAHPKFVQDGLAKSKGVARHGRRVGGEKAALQARAVGDCAPKRTQQPMRGRSVHDCLAVRVVSFEESLPPGSKQGFLFWRCGSRSGVPPARCRKKAQEFRARDGEKKDQTSRSCSW